VQVHDPARVHIPSYHPDTPETRQDWAQYYDGVTATDVDAGKRLDEIAAAGLAEDTIIFYFADHGPGMPRSKRWPSDSGLHVPLVVYIPDKFQDLRPADYRAGGKSDRLVSFVDFAPTLLSLAGIEPLDWMQGHAFLGRFQAPPQPFLYGFRGRMDERYDLVRSITDGRFVYIRNYMPHKIYGQHISYMFETPTTRVWKKLHDAGQLTPDQDLFWKTKPPEELYDLRSDPDEVHNLAALPEHQETLGRCSLALRRFAVRTQDLGFLTEGQIHSRSRGSTPYDMGHDESKYPFQRIFDTAERASTLDLGVIPELKLAIKDEDAAVRYWAALGFLMLGRDAVRSAHGDLTAALGDESPDVRIAAAEALGQYGEDADLTRALGVLGKLADWSKTDVFTSLAALNAIDALGDRAGSLRAILHGIPSQANSPDPRYQSYVPRLLSDLKGKFP
jgi:uncharacterized sulfatase